MEPFRRADSGTLSMREKTLLKRRVTKEHNSNFRAGYVHIDEEQLHKTGIRGRKAYFVYCLVALLVIAVLANLALTLSIMVTLKISKEGMTGLEFIPSGILTRFTGESFLEDVFPVKSTVGSLPYDSLEVSGNGSNPVVLKVKNGGSAVSVDASSVSMETDLFLVVDPDTGRVVFTTEYAENMPLPKGVDKIKLQQAVTNRINSGENDLKFESPKGGISVRGSEGLTTISDSFQAEAGRAINIDSSGGIRLTGEDGIFLDKKLPLYDGPDTDINTEKVCVIMPEGRLFTVPAGSLCDEGLT